MTRPLAFSSGRGGERRLGAHGRAAVSYPSAERVQPYSIWLVNWFMSK